MTYTIRHVEPRDVNAVHQIMLSRHVLIGSMRLPIQSPEYTASRLAYTAGEYKMVAEADGEVVGFGELLLFPNVPRHAHAGELNFVVTRDDYQGRGVGRALMEAIVDMSDNWLNLHRLSLTVWDTNHRAVALYQHFGFQIEGTMRDYAWLDGAYVDALLMARIRPGK